MSVISANKRSLYQTSHIARPDGPLTQDNPPRWLQNKHGVTTKLNRRKSNSTAGNEDTVWFLGDESQDNALAIVDGVEAWKALTNGKGSLWRRFNRERSERRASYESKGENTESNVLPSGHPTITQRDDEDMGCPFASLAHLGQQPPGNGERPGSPPTPPHTQGHFDNYSAIEGKNEKDLSPPPSVTGSISKCPIRLLDERSPEEIAEYFEHHKHEIPRSHEICVKRYQSNAQSIRQLDAKYGSLVNMIQGLGLKHQPLLPTKNDDEGFTEIDAISNKKVASWADNVNDSGEAGLIHSTLPATTSANPAEREGHFDRPLKEVRVGESPSRPWGISVPGAAAIANPTQNEAMPIPRDSETKPPLENIGQIANPSRSHDTRGHREDKPEMVFTGPVFIGYSADQAAALIEKCGWDPQGPPC